MAELAAALVAALADLTVVEQGRTAKIPTKDGKNYSYKYADIGDVVKLTRPALKEHGIVALTPVHDHGDGLAVTVTLLHVSGERLDFGPFPFPPGKDAQATGSAITYHRRYALVAALGLAAGDDDDGAAASPRQSAAPPVAWNKNVAKQHLVAKLGKDDAAKAWTGLELDQITEWSESLADSFVDQWRADPGEVSSS